MKLLPQNKEITCKGKDLLDVIQKIEFIRESLANIGRCYSQPIGENITDNEYIDYSITTTKFIDENDVCRILMQANNILINNFDLTMSEDDMDDVERACEDIKFWSPKQNLIESRK